MRKSLFKGESRKRVESNWLGKRKDSRFLQAIKAQSLKASAADPDIQLEIDNLDGLFNWGDETCDRLIERIETIDLLNDAFEGLGTFLKEFYTYEECTLTEAICEFADICENRIIEQNNQLKEQIELEITLLENYQRNDLMQMVDVVTDRQEKKRDFEHYQSKIQKLSQAIEKKASAGKEVSESEKEKKIRNEEKFVSAQASWEAAKDSSVITLNDLYESRFQTLDYLLSSHSRNEIEWSEKIEEMYRSSLSGVEAARQNGSSILALKDQEGGLVKSRTGFLGRVKKSKFFTDIGPATGEIEFDTLLYKMDFIYVAVGELKVHLKKLTDGLISLSRGGNDLAIRVKQQYLQPGPEHRESAQYYADTWARFSKTFNESITSLGRQLFNDISNYEQNMIQPIYAASKTYHEKKKQFEHYQIKCDKLRKKGSGKLKSNIQKLNTAEADYKKISEALISSMRRTCNTRFEFIDGRLHDFMKTTNGFFQALHGSLEKLEPILPNVEAPQSVPPPKINDPLPRDSDATDDHMPEPVVVQQHIDDPIPPPSPSNDMTEVGGRPLPPVPGKRYPGSQRVSISEDVNVPSTFAPPPPRAPVSRSLPPKPRRDPAKLIPNSSGEDRRTSVPTRRSSGLPRVSRSQRRLSKGELPGFEKPAGPPPPKPPGNIPAPIPVVSKLPPPEVNALPPPSPKSPDAIAGPPPPPTANRNPPPMLPKPQVDEPPPNLPAHVIQPADVPNPPVQPAVVPPKPPIQPVNMPKPPIQPADMPKPPSQSVDVPKPPTPPPEKAEASVPNMDDFDLYAGDDEFDLYAE